MSPSKIVALAVLLGIAAFLGYCEVRTTSLNAAFDKVVLGDTEQAVVAKMGHPHRVLDGCGYYHSRPPAGCAREYVYFPPFSIVEEAWTIGFDAHGAVTGTAHFVSP